MSKEVREDALNEIKNIGQTIGLFGPKIGKNGTPEKLTPSKRISYKGKYFKYIYLDT